MQSCWIQMLYHMVVACQEIVEAFPETVEASYLGNENASER